MLLKWPFKDPDEVLDYGLDWTPRLAGDTIATSTWIVPDGITKVTDSFTTTSTEIWLSGGTLGVTHGITNRVVTSGGRKMDQTVSLSIRAK